GFSERTDAAIEPKLSMQWFCKMDELAKPALEYVENGTIKLIPEKFFASYKHWMENVKDWCISRQLWWGQRIPAWYNSNNEWVVAKTEAEAIQEFEAQGKSTEGIRQEDDVLDTWFSSGLWPMSVFDGVRNPDNEDFKYYYPTNDLVTAPEILFFWVARMIIAGYEFRGEKPFNNVYLTGIVRDKQRRKMSKSLGNSPDPLDLIEKYGADGVRVGMLLSSPAGNDLMFDEDLCKQGSAFVNKIWNSFKLIKGWEIDPSKPQAEASRMALTWYKSRFNQVLQQLEDDYSKYRMSDALMATYKLVWDDYCSWLLEMVKPPYGEAIDTRTYDEVIEILENNLKILHPFTPFISEEIWQQIAPRSKEDALTISKWPETEKYDEVIIQDFNYAAEVITGVRSIRKSNNISFKEQISLSVLNPEIISDRFDAVIRKLGNISEINYVEEKVNAALSFRVKSNEYFIPVEGAVDLEAERKKMQEELDYTRGFLMSVEKKLS